MQYQDKLTDRSVYLDDHIKTDGDGPSDGKPRSRQPNIPQHTLTVCVQLALMILVFLIVMFNEA